MAFSHHYFPFNDLNNKEFYDEIQPQHVLSFEYFNNLIYNNSDFISPNERDNDPDYNLLNDQSQLFLIIIMPMSGKIFVPNIDRNLNCYSVTLLQ